jgi:hypothetical protein
MANTIINLLNSLWNTTFSCNFVDKTPSIHFQLHEAGLNTATKITHWFNNTISPLKILETIHNSTFPNDYKTRIKATRITLIPFQHNTYFPSLPTTTLPKTINSLPYQHHTNTQPTRLNTQINNKKRKHFKLTTPTNPLDSNTYTYYDPYLLPTAPYTPHYLSTTDKTDYDSEHSDTPSTGWEPTDTIWIPPKFLNKDNRMNRTDRYNYRVAKRAELDKLSQAALDQHIALLVDATVTM